jgi:BirA family transcriptional regulator, biotin operon repressor / biotin---[acetyl-CoA-carboxylase] ligase
VEYPTGVTDLARCLPVPPGSNLLLGLVLTQLYRLFDVYAAAGFSALRGAWQQRNAFADLPVRIIGETDELAGVCAGVDEDGALLLRTPGGVQRVLSGEVSLRLA